METFRIRAVPGDTTCTLYLNGEADLACVDDIILMGTLGLDVPEIRTLIINFEACTFIDSTVMGGLVALRNHAIAIDKTVIATRVPDRIRRILAITGLDAVFEVPAPNAATT